MIVKCEQCQTRFKIPDDKVTDKGVKVRCTKCQHTFRVTRDGAILGVGAVAAPKAADPDPFAQFGAGVAGPAEATRPGMYALGVQASRRPDAPLQPSYAAQMDQPSAIFETPTRVGAPPSAPSGRRPLQEPAARPAPAPAPFDFAAAMGAPETTQPGSSVISHPGPSNSLCAYCF